METLEVAVFLAMLLFCLQIHSGSTRQCRGVARLRLCNWPGGGGGGGWAGRGDRWDPGRGTWAVSSRDCTSLKNPCSQTFLFARVLTL